MTDKEYFLTLSEHDYCNTMLNMASQKMLSDQNELKNKPIIQLIDKACGYDGIVWEDVALCLWWSEETLQRRLKIDIPHDGLDDFISSLKKFMERNGKLDVYENLKKSN